MCGAPILGDLARHIQRVGLMRCVGGAGAVVDDLHVVLVGKDLHCGLGADEGIAADVCATFDRFEEEAGGGTLIGGDEAAIGEHGGELIAHEAPGQRDEIALLCEFSKCGEVGYQAAVCGMRW